MNVNSNERIWLELSQKGDKEAFGRLVEAYQGPVFNLCYRMLDNAREAEEAAQETFIRVYMRLADYDPQHKFSTWVLSIASNYCIDILRKRRAIFLSIDEPLPSHPALTAEKEQGPEQRAMANEEQQLVQRLLHQLPEDYRQAVILYYWYDHSYEEIAQVMSTSVSAIKSRLFRARRLLAEASQKLNVTHFAREEIM